MYLTQYHRFASKHVTLAYMSNAFLTVTVTVTAEFVVRLLQSARRCVRYIVSTRNLPPLDQIYSRVQRRKKITQSHGIVTSVVRATPQVNGRRQTYPSHYTHTP